MHIDCLLYLRGLFYFVCSKTVESFKDFFSIASKEIFPKDLIAKEIWQSLSQEQRDMIKQETFYKESADFKKISDVTKKTSLNKLKLIDEEFENMEDLCNLKFSF